MPAPSRGQRVTPIIPSARSAHPLIPCLAAFGHAVERLREYFGGWIKTVRCWLFGEPTTRKVDSSSFQGSSASGTSRTPSFRNPPAHDARRSRVPYSARAKLSVGCRDFAPLLYAWIRLKPARTQVMRPGCNRAIPSGTCTRQIARFNSRRSLLELE